MEIRWKTKMETGVFVKCSGHLRRGVAAPGRGRFGGRGLGSSSRLMPPSRGGVGIPVCVWE